MLGCPNQRNPLKEQEILPNSLDAGDEGKRVGSTLIVQSEVRMQLLGRFWCRAKGAGGCGIHGQEFVTGRSKLSAARGGVNQSFTTIAAWELPDPTAFMRSPTTLARY